MVRRQRMESDESTESGLPQREADAANGLDQFRGAGCVELSAQIADVDIDHVRIDVRMLAPDVIEDGVAREHMASVAGEVFQQGELTCRQLDLLAATVDLPGGDVDLEVADPDELVRLDPAHDGAKPGHEL